MADKDFRHTPFSYLEPAVTDQPAIELVGIDKKFGAVHANKDINLTVAKGSIHGIIGENGAGKSTLMSIIYGFYQADSGEIRVNGQPITIRDSQAAIAAGIGMVHQHFMLVDNFTVLENIMLGAEGGALLAKGVASARAELKRLETEYGLEVNPDALIEQLPVGLQQRVEILKAMYRGAEILILDEPTGVLTPAEADHLFRILGVLRDEGKTVVLITHKLREIMAITDTVSVMRRGEMVATRKTSETTVEELAEAHGRPPCSAARPEGRGQARRCHAFRPQPDGQGQQRRDDGRQRLLRCPRRRDRRHCRCRRQWPVGTAGSDRRHPQAGSGEILLDGQTIDKADPARLRELGLAHIPEDRHHMGLVLKFEEYENAVLGYHRRPAYSVARCSISTPSARMPWRRSRNTISARRTRALKTANFSGGNQQKIVVAREIERDPKMLIIGQPTRGVDIGAIEFIHRRIIEMRDAGKAILLVSVELDEIRALSDRILVMFAGHVVGEKTRRCR